MKHTRARTVCEQLYRFNIRQDEIVKIFGIPYRHVGDGTLEGGTDPEWARTQRDKYYNSLPVQHNDS